MDRQLDRGLLPAKVCGVSKGMWELLNKSFSNSWKSTGRYQNNKLIFNIIVFSFNSD
jgi:hypothetical protein